MADWPVISLLVLPVVAWLAWHHWPAALAGLVLLIPTYLLRFSIVAVPTNLFEVSLVTVFLIVAAQTERRRCWWLAIAGARHAPSRLHCGSIANARANVLTCRFALLAPNDWNHLVPNLIETHKALRTHRDWRARKTLRLLAELSAERGRLQAALQWVRRAVA
ncbi:hypothetical protein IH781_01885, partial [Patescibacteria group bacterium]|nr:hypothetical protein [Patescibacteria group bacterium]